MSIHKRKIKLEWKCENKRTLIKATLYNIEFPACFDKRTHVIMCAQNKLPEFTVIAPNWIINEITQYVSC